MHAAPTNIATTDFAAEFTAEIHLAQRDALQTIHKVMLCLTDGITRSGGRQSDEETEDPAQARTTTQRIRLCLQAARDILHLSPSINPINSATPPSRTTREIVADTQQGRIKGPSSTQQREATPKVNQRDLLESTLTHSTPAPQTSSSLLSTAGTAAASDGKRSRPATEDKGAVHRTASSHVAERASPQTRDAGQPAAPKSSATSSAPSAPKAAAALPPRPQYFTEEESRQIIATIRSRQDRLTPHLYARIQEWNRYAVPAGLSCAFGIPEEVIEARKPLQQTQPPPQIPPP